MKAPDKKIQKGVTLLELLVALAVFAISAISILDTISTTNTVVQDLEQRTLGHWIAGNKISESNLANKWPSLGTTRDEVTMADRNWFLITKIEATARPDMRRITVEVRLDKDNEAPIIRRHGFVGNLK